TTLPASRRLASARPALAPKCKLIFARTLSLTAGFCEEVLYRGFLMWYAMTWLPGAAAVLVSAVLFGAAHLYLGWGVGVLRATIMGGVLGAAYLLTGTLWVPIVLHAAVDVTSGLTASTAFEQGASVTCQVPGMTAQQRHAADCAQRRR
ncbi:MAG: CPBP family intramembrane metalloprotease, partial [Acidobacteria bacterium]|nr:CPBP family intramembrane metalloprotease [Acidobacteriota bacterium]